MKYLAVLLLVLAAARPAFCEDWNFVPDLGLASYAGLNELGGRSVYAFGLGFAAIAPGGFSAKLEAAYAHTLHIFLSPSQYDLFSDGTPYFALALGFVHRPNAENHVSFYGKAAIAPGRFMGYGGEIGYTRFIAGNLGLTLGISPLFLVGRKGMDTNTFGIMPRFALAYRFGIPAGQKE